MPSGVAGAMDWPCHCDSGAAAEHIAANKVWTDATSPGLGGAIVGDVTILRNAFLNMNRSFQKPAYATRACDTALGQNILAVAGHRTGHSHKLKFFAHFSHKNCFR